MCDNNIGVLIASRLSSTRLKNKALVDIEGYTLLERVIYNVQESKKVDDIVVATSNSSSDDAIEQLCKRKGFNFFRGCEKNVIQRFFDAAKQFNLNIIIRVTGDNPLTSYEIIDYLIKSHFNENADYTKLEDDSAPIGTSVEIINFYAFEKLLSTHIDLSFSEYMTFYFTNNPEVFKINVAACPQEFKRPNYRLTVDYPEDLQVVRKIYKNLAINDQSIPLLSTIKLLDDNSAINSINRSMDILWKNNTDLINRINNVTKIK